MNEILVNNVKQFADEQVKVVELAGGVPLYGWVLIVVFVSLFLFLVGGAFGFYFARKKMIKEIKENPPITEKMIRAMFLQMGRKPSESQIKNVMRSMRNAK